MLKMHAHVLATPQSEAARADQIVNSAGGYVWELNPWQRLDRFLILGTEGGSYYVSEGELTRDNVRVVEALLAEDWQGVVNRVVEVSEGGRAYKNDYALFVLALASLVGDVSEALPRVARTGTHLFTFAQYATSLRGWGRSLRRAVGGWYNRQRLDDLAYQTTKYRQRGSWSHRDLLRLSHPVPDGTERSMFYHAVAHGLSSIGRSGYSWEAYLDAAAEAADCPPNRAAELIRQHNLPREVLATESLNHPVVWEALLDDMPMTAMIRNLAVMTRVGVLDARAGEVADRLTDRERLKRARVHPLAVLAALITYQRGEGARGQHSWTPITRIVDALDEAFYLSFDSVQPSGKRIMYALDVSGSMEMWSVGGIPGLSPRVASAALALVSAATERDGRFVAFCDGLTPLTISPRQRLDDVVRTISDLPYGGTDCALPMLYAMRNNIDVDAFVILTDSETWYGKTHPFEALRQYRRQMGTPARLVVVGMIGSRFTIADPSDAGMLDVVGFSTDTPSVISEFLAGRI